MLVGGHRSSLVAKNAIGRKVAPIPAEEAKDCENSVCGVVVYGAAVRMSS